jgi:hypothetical protein
MTGRHEPETPKPGEIYLMTKAASVQFAPGREFLFRIIRVHNWPTYDGWVWLDGYKLDPAGDAVERRTLFVQIAGLIKPEPALRPVPSQRHRNTAPVTQQRRAGNELGPQQRKAANRHG